MLGLLTPPIMRRNIVLSTGFEDNLSCRRCFSCCDCSYSIFNLRRSVLSSLFTLSRYDCSRNSRIALAANSALCSSCRENPKFCSNTNRSKGCCLSNARCDTRSCSRIPSYCCRDISVFDTEYHPIVMGTPDDTAGLHPTIIGCSLTTTDPNETDFDFFDLRCIVEDFGCESSGEFFVGSATASIICNIIAIL